MKFKLFFVVMIVSFGSSLAEMTDSEARERLIEDLGQGVPDVVGDFPSAYMHSDVTNKYAYIMQQVGWDRGRLLDELKYIVTNYCADASLFATSSYSLVYYYAIQDIVKCDPSNAVNTLDFAFRNAPEDECHVAYDGYASLLGVGHDAFEIYMACVSDPTLSGSRINEAFNALMARPELHVMTPAMTNRMVALSLMVKSRDGESRYWADVALRRFWPEYGTSSNRLEDCNLVIRSDHDKMITNYFSHVRSELLALPDGTMQLLPTNQFYNVED